MVAVQQAHSVSHPLLLEKPRRAATPVDPDILGVLARVISSAPSQS
jgi:hypothetical protein